MIAFRTLLCCLLLLFTLPAAMADSRCSERPKSLLLPAKISCSHQTTWIDSGVVGARQVIYQTPLGTPPSGGWPVVLVYQGSFFPLDNFIYYSNQSFGGYYEGKLVRTLLDNGYAVIAPSAPADLFWQTNIPGLAQAYELSTDYDFLDNVLDAIAAGHFGPLDAQRQYATGISSGGYNTSRMAVSFPGRFRALAIQSGSYATCSGPLCVMPNDLPADHPPTLFLHGFVDAVVPWWSMDLYYDRLLQQGVETARHTEVLGGHEWFAASPGKILAWFNAHP
ncbi:MULTISPECIES: plasmid partitioning protein [unclassified Pseudomonas]|uniref:extracellular medium-chain-length polyhydroxyalkanoate depolymerase n=1 Tax=unclassified Pseudomonas TaxID=196821 RepID=UPI002447C57C|nr:MULTISPECIES: plasmid partitioning protein [unclassified Pseudomonas]MDG9923374.1 plasmid partitioning protein [Pseudomonas sp. GD04045]MDH0035502.1 plasmid partitioning protein [Pseudomonas sp. GD04019]